VISDLVLGRYVEIHPELGKVILERPHHELPKSLLIYEPPMVVGLGGRGRACRGLPG